MKRPLGLVALFYGGGLILGDQLQPPLLLLFAVSFFFAAAAITLPKVRPVLIWPLIFIVAWTNLVSRTAVVSPHDLRQLLGDAPEDVILRGTLVETPDERIHLRDGNPAPRTSAKLTVSGVQRDGQWLPAVGCVAVNSAGKLPRSYFGGEKVEIAGIISRPKPRLASGLFDYRSYLKRQGIHFELKSLPEEWRPLTTVSSPPRSDRFLAWARATMARGLPEVDQPLKLLWSMTLGSKSVVTSDAYDPFIQSGTMHLFAISGLHVALIAGILVCLCRVIRIRREWCGAAVVPMLWLYAAATGWQPSAVRSTLMMTIVIGGWSLRRPSDLLNSLAAAAVIILVWDPQQLFQASFQLSFFVVLSIASLLPPLEKMRDRWLMPDPMLPAELVSRWRRCLAGPLRWLTTAFITSAAAWLGSWPITVYYFHLFNPVTLLANLIMVPLSSAALACNLASLLCGFWFPAACELFNHSAWFWMKLMMTTGEQAVKLPGAFFYAPAPHPMDFLIYYGLLLAILTGAAFRPAWRKWTAAGLIAIAITYGWRWYSAGQTTEITVLPFNGGGAVYCDAPGRADDLLFDCGSAFAVEFVTEPFLRAQGLNRLPRLALSHGDLHVMGGVELLRASMPVQEILTSSARFRSASYRNVIQSLADDPDRWRQVNTDDRAGTWTVLNPDRAMAFTKADDAALVLQGEFHGIRLLLLSELGRNGQEALLASGRPLRSEIVIAGLPESGEPLSNGLLEAVQPRLIVITDSEFPVNKRSGPSLRLRLGDLGIPVIYTRQTGAVSLTLRRQGWVARAGGREFRSPDRDDAVGNSLEGGSRHSEAKTLTAHNVEPDNLPRLQP